MRVCIFADTKVNEKKLFSLLKSHPQFKDHFFQWDEPLDAGHQGIMAYMKELYMHPDIVANAPYINHYLTHNSLMSRYSLNINNILSGYSLIVCYNSIIPDFIINDINKKKVLSFTNESPTTILSTIVSKNNENL